MMKNILLFDWGDTLMVDFPDQVGEMRFWDTVEPVEGALETIRILSEFNLIYVATGAEESSVQDIKAAFERVNMDSYISGYYCQRDLGTGKDSPSFYTHIIERLGVKPETVTMIGDSFEKDVKSALRAGLNTVWFNPGKLCNPSGNTVTQVHTLKELRFMFAEAGQP